ncbi:MAG: molybdopterin cofactor-binding domain-containing protein [Actinomycetota bacterium]|nr:molybdopterin cofactor-binding domain-containing protein [Actinomycetota bacterium]MEC8464286.1 molybdopterin cofactor-binding domain-containing protein [Actinomycetota bacterium]MEC8520848.1 molybdopterin cofactor-binding domain-containing protein [Actinomycetota bacterium]MED5329337.1 molybdopterin cofactor-binding domain-containing protein [Actinomycetota bacterium]
MPGEIQFTVNGKPSAITGDHPHLLSALRDELDVTSPKDGCSPSGQCGCCTVLIDGKAVVACQQSVDACEGREITTLEGLPESERQQFADAFAACGGLQCGFCIPGIVMRAHYQISKKGSSLTRESMAPHLGAHLCRCTGYVKILDAIEAVAHGTPVEPPTVKSGVGARGMKYEAHPLTLGDRPYIDDIRVPGMLHAALHLTDHTRASIKNIDVANAIAAPGVVSVLTAADIPGELRSGLIYKDWPLMIPVGGTTSFGGDVLAVVVADTREHARAAAELIEVEYTVHSPVTDAKAALASDSPVAVWGTDSNVLSVSAYQRDEGLSIEDALASSAHVVSETFTTQRIEHAFLEPESTLAVPSGDGEQKTLHVYSGGQGVWDDRNDIAAILGVERKRVTVELVSNGGAFGGKEDMSNQGHAALAAWLLGHPVKCTLSRVESFRMHAKRHPITLDVKAGCDADGVLTGLHVRAIGDSGAYASVGMKVLERAAGHVAGPYRWQSLDIEATAVRTNNPICGAFRGFGANQAQFATEGVIDRLAELAGFDPWEFRSKNVITPGDTWGPGQVMDDGAGGARECLDAIKPDYDRARSEGRSVGLAIGMKNSGLGNGFREVCGAVVHFRDDGRIEVRHGWTEMGQGVHTVALQIAAQELNVDPERIDVIIDTTRELGFGQTTGSRGTLMTAGSVAAACQVALAANCEVGVDHHGEYVVDWTHHLGDPEHPNPTIHSCFSYAAQLVEIDHASGAIDRVLAVHDVGKAVNPTLVEGQIEGSVHMGLGYALTEDFPSDETGMPAVETLRQLGILRAKDIPKIDVKVVEVPQPRSPYGIKGVGEIGLVPTAPAVAAALYSFDGERRRTLPMRRQ